MSPFGEQAMDTYWSKLLGTRRSVYNCSRDLYGLWEAFLDMPGSHCLLLPLSTTSVVLCECGNTGWVRCGIVIYKSCLQLYM